MGNSIEEAKTKKGWKDGQGKRGQQQLPKLFKTM